LRFGKQPKLPDYLKIQSTKLAGFFLTIKTRALSRIRRQTVALTVIFSFGKSVRQELDKGDDYVRGS